MCHRLDALVELAGVPSFQVARGSATEVAQCYLQMFELEGKREKTNVTRIDGCCIFFFFPKCCAVKAAVKVSVMDTSSLLQHFALSVHVWGPKDDTDITTTRAIILSFPSSLPWVLWNFSIDDSIKTDMAGGGSGCQRSSS